MHKITSDPPTQDTTFVGFDLRNLQPDLSQINLGIEYRDLSRRITWVHGDLCVDASCLRT